MTTTGPGAAGSERDRYAEWDAAYVLGALATEERHDYERHLRSCADCTQRVAEIAGIPGLLGLVPTAQVLESEDHAFVAPGRPGSTESPESAASPSGDDSLPRLLAAARRRRRRGQMLQAGLMVAVAAVAATVAIVLPARLAPAGVTEPAGALVTLHQVVPNPLSADVRLVAQPGGTRIDGSCSYGLPESGTGSSTGTGTAAERAYAMFVTDRNGEATQVASWLAGPGMTVPLSGTTKLAADEISSVDIRLQPRGIVLLAVEPGLESAQ
ncbi:zf-HC2 domain-containing protein [Cryobacterium sp. 10I5]|uniref:anti-sigma factor family protein n=1 Tax=Cryobacterium sp. 10I5 TaxID=3048581 RepID=UPI002B23105E|nr:zf-HC2 domain-containing protein [Cryobacterium sp. 10I5]MEB0264558.1 zf-HC2 domain-containing protein [Cryobacterium sp. 10I5]